jgi:hypothetical protein
MSKIRSRLTTGAAIAAAALGGGAIANAATSSSTTSGSTASGSGASPSAPSAPQGQTNFPPHGTAAHEDAEKTVTGTAATKVQAAAVRSVGSGTAGTVTTDFTGNGYEVTVTKSDGSKVEVHLDSSFNVVQGGPGSPGGRGYGG